MERLIILEKRIDEAFDTYPQFGKDAQSTESMLISFEDVLRGFTPKVIDEAFRDWMCGNSNDPKSQKGKKMPLPADIRDICLKFRTQENQYKRIDAAHEKRMALPAPKKEIFGSWMDKQWHEFTERDKAMFLDGLGTTGVDDGYLEYLKKKHGIPMSFMKGEESK